MVGKNEPHIETSRTSKQEKRARMSWSGKQPHVVLEKKRMSWSRNSRTTKQEKRVRMVREKRARMLGEIMVRMVREKRVRMVREKTG